MQEVRQQEQQPRPVLTIDVIEDVLFVGPALRAAVAERGLPLQVQRLATSWMRYIESFDVAARLVVVRGELEDHVPTVLKVRALAEIDSVPIVLADRPSARHAQRLLEAGALAVLTANDSFDELLGVLSRARSGVARMREVPGEVRLSDRELQVAALYTGRTAPSARVISELLGLPLASVRTYLQRARTALSVVGNTSTRKGLGAALRADGWLDSNDHPFISE